MQIDDLAIPHLVQLPQQEQIKLILQIRARRIIVPERKNAVSGKTKVKKIASISLETLNREQLTQIAAILMGRK